ncbi:MAG: helix-turn-helix transcriptional regulator [Christensenellaceae bacterium]|nr:helix-turn-helix transcriptional regulator [Christensenellaceae bacterium]
MLADRLAHLINKLGIKKGEFAGHIGFSQAYISMLLSGKKNNPSSRFVDAVCHKFHIDPQWLLYGEGEMFSAPAADLSASDLSLLQKYRTLPLSEQQLVDQLMDAMILKNYSEHTAK